VDYYTWSIDPAIFKFGFLQVRWYSLLFVGSFFIGLLIMQKIFKKEGQNPEILDSLLIYLLIGTIIGARLVHCLFYEPEYYLNHPLEILYIWKGGLASHGGLLGAIIALWLFVKKYKIPFLWLMSRLSIPAMLTASAIRFGNFFNSEILGKKTDVPWAIIFKRVDNIPRHPAQLYEAFSYLLIFFLLIYLYKKLPKKLSIGLLPAIGAGLSFGIRFFIEFFKTRQATYQNDFFLNTGQILSIPFVLFCIIWSIFWINKYNKGNI